METLANLESFVRSAEAQSFSAAARRLGLTPAGVNRNVAKLEANLGVRPRTAASTSFPKDSTCEPAIPGRWTNWAAASACRARHCTNASLAPQTVG